MKYAYASAGPGFFDKTKEDVTVIVSDVPLDAKALEDQFERMKMADAGKLHAFEITFDADAKPISTSFRHNGFTKASPSGLSSEDVFEKKTFDGKTVEGRYKSAKPHEFFGDTYAFDVAFKADDHAQGEAGAADRGGDGGRPEEPAGEGVRGLPQGRPEGGPRGDEEAHDEGPGEEPRRSGREEDGRHDQDDVRDGHQGPEGRGEGRHGRADRRGKQDGNVQNGVVHMVKEGGAWKVQREEWKN